METDTLQIDTILQTALEISVGRNFARGQYSVSKRPSAYTVERYIKENLDISYQANPIDILS